MYPWYKIAPGERFAYSENWSNTIGTEDPIATSNWEKFDSSAPLEVVRSDDFSGATSSVLVEAAADALLGTMIRLINKITTESSDQWGSRSIYLKVEEL